MRRYFAQQFGEGLKLDRWESVNLVPLQSIREGQVKVNLKEMNIGDLGAVLLGQALQKYPIVELDLSGAPYHPLGQRQRQREVTVQAA